MVFAELRLSFQTEQGILNVLGVTEESAAKRKAVGCDQMRPRPKRGMLLMRLSRHLDHSKRKHTSKDSKHIACTHVEAHNLINPAGCI